MTVRRSLIAIVNMGVMASVGAANDWAADPVSVVLKTTGEETRSALDAHYAVWSSAKASLTRCGSMRVE